MLDHPLASLLVVVSLVGCATTAEQALEEESEDGGVPVHGTMKLRYRGRSSGSQQDHDLYGVLTLDVGDAQTDRVTGHFMGRMALDLDGSPTQPGENPFFSLEDTRGNDVDSTLYYFYADVHDVGPLETVRLGRQTLYETPAFAWFDGLLLETPGAGKSDLQAGLYGGVPVRQYGLFPADLILGAYLNTWPWDGGRARFDWMHVDDEFALTANNDDLFGLGLWQTLGEAWRVEGQYSVLNAESRDMRLAANWYDPEGDLSVNATYYQLLTPQRDLALEFDPLFPTLFEYFPFYQASLLATKGFGESLRLQGGLDFRRVSDGEDVGVFNRDYDRGH
jgi:hypothetical protein